MLKVVSHFHPDQKEPFLEVFDDQSETWIVSDLRSKFEVQNHLLQTKPGFEDSSVLRAGELWRLLLRRLRPEIRIAPRDFMMSWLTHHLKKMSRAESARLLQPQAAKSFLTLMDLLAPVFLNPQGPAQLRDFFKNSPEAAGRWQIWSELSYALFQIIQKENWILPAWIPSLLLQEKNLESAWNRNVWIDLGAGLRQSEVELFKRLSKTVDVTAFIPDPDANDSFNFLLQPSKELQSAASKTEKFKSHDLKKNTHCLRLSGPLAEIKQTVAQVRQWLEQGIQPSEIAVIAPGIEDYWPLLEPFFEKEGIPVQKDAVTRLQAWPSVASWLARLRLRMGSVSFADVEAGLNTDELNLRYEKFRALFRHALELEDLQRGRELEAFFKYSAAPSREIDCEEFMSWAASDWRDPEDWTAYEILLKEILQTLPSMVKMDADAWVSYLESLAVKKEIRVRPGDFSGVALVELTAMNGSFRKRIFLGLTESNFKKNATVLVGAGELNRLGWDYGFFLDHPEQNLLNFELHWALQSPSEEDMLLYPATGFGGSAEAPHPLWLSEGGGAHVHAPPETRWDEIQGSARELSMKLQRDLGLIEIEKLRFKDTPGFSASVLEKYRSCAFQFAAERIFYLLDPPERDLDLDPRSKGSLAHKIFESLTESPRRYDWSEDELRAKIDQLRDTLKLQDQTGVFWEIEREKHLRLAQRFLKFEQEWTRQFPDAKIEAREKSFEFFFNPTDGTFHSKMQSGYVVLKGTIDRLETDSHGWKLVVDYKTRFESKRAFGGWMKSNFLQLALYAWAVDRGFVTGLSPGQVGGAVTFAYQSMEKRRGLILPEVQGRLMPKVDPKEASLDLKKKFYEEFEQTLKETLMEALSGHIRPFPHQEDQSVCEKCRWSRACRAPHLNT